MNTSFEIRSLSLKSIRIFRAVVTGMAILLAAAAPAQAGIIIVNTTSDGNVIYPPWEPPPPPLCSLRDAITAANTNQPVGGCVQGDSGRDFILFSLGTGTPTIRPRRALPIIIEPLTIRGDSGGATRVELDGSNALGTVLTGPLVHGLYFAVGGNTIHNLVINRFSGNGIVFASDASGVLPDPTPPQLPEPKIPRSEGPVDPKIPQVEDGPDNNYVYGSFIGTDATGTIALGNGSGFGNAGIVSTSHKITIGHPTDAYRNVISGNHGHGLMLAGKWNRVRGNFIGLDVTGTLPLGNQFDGIHIVGPQPGLPPSANGVIGANPYSTDTYCGVMYDPTTGRVLDDRRRCGNRIAYNNGNGITSGFNLFTFMANSILSNGLLGIDVDFPGVTPNAPNRDRNFPVLTSYKREFNLQGPPSTRVYGSIAIGPNQERVIQIFHSPTCDPSNHGEGQDYRGSVKVSGNGSFEFLLPMTTGGLVTATSTNGLVSTSEFSACLPI